MLLGQAAPASCALAMQRRWIKSRWRLTGSINLSKSYVNTLTRRYVRTFQRVNVRTQSIQLSFKHRRFRNMTIEHAEPQAADTPAVVQEQLYCALTGQPINAETAYWAPPLVTARELVAAIVGGALHSPATLGLLSAIALIVVPIVLLAMR